MFVARLDLPLAAEEFEELFALFYIVKYWDCPGRAIVCSASSKGGSNGAEAFVGTDAKMLAHENDFVALNPSSDADFLTTSLQQIVGRYMPARIREAYAQIIWS